MNNDFLKYFDIVKEVNNNSGVAVAVSGGIDSLSLTLLANEWAKSNGVKIIALTVDHKLRKSSTAEAKYVFDLLMSFGIETHILTWDGDKPTSNIEAIARDVRYKLLTDFCKKNKIKTLLLGHHLQDQAENFLIRLFRGSGISGLSSMKLLSEINGIKIIRPFLNIEKDDLKNYLLKNNLKWVEDESNSDEKYLRNKIRNFLNSFDDKNNIVRRINSTISVFQVANNIIDKEVDSLENVIYFYDSEYNYYKVKLWKFLNLDREIQYKIILKISKKITENFLNPRSSKVNRLLENLENLKKYTFYGCVFEKINTDDFVCYREYNSIKDKNNYLKKGELNQYLKLLKENNYQKYKKIKDFKGYKKEILYTLKITDYKR